MAVLFTRFAKAIFAIFERSLCDFQFLNPVIVSIGSSVGAKFCALTLGFFFMTFLALFVSFYYIRQSG